MTLRKSLLPLLLALLLLVAQQAGWTHALSHLGDQTGSASQTKQVPADKLCQQCLAFAQIGSALQRAPLTFLVPPLEDCLTPVLAAMLAPVLLRCGFQSRAPPPSL
ncbi:MAG: hypothetical protein H7234_06925 [Herminiimonas sp.]|nr:hypothetical protein [Herminiimonas sp.]